HLGLAETPPAPTERIGEATRADQEAARLHREDRRAGRIEAALVEVPHHPLDAQRLGSRVSVEADDGVALDFPEHDALRRRLVLAVGLDDPRAGGTSAFGRRVRAGV